MPTRILNFRMTSKRIAGMFLTTECVLVEEKKDEPAAPAMGGGMPGMM